MCKKRRGLPEALLHAKELAVKNCQEQFEFDQWNCSKRELLFKKIYRETAFMYSIASSAVMFSVAKACSLGSLAGCKCGAHGKQKNSTWQWGGCADNSKYAKKITRKFLQLQKKGDTFNAIVKYNAEVGIKVVMANEEIACRCHGVSGSCSVRICWKRIRPFDVISKQLKALYHSAIQVQPRNNIGSFGNGKSSRKLLFLENRLDFCPSTVNRRCKNKENCATLCCGRNTYNETKQVSYRCDCSWRVKGEYNLRCRSCPKNVTVFRCT
ncbi:wnt domain containing protein [Asbolus verrucosus]|uniref:Protein Wnt n=1 Tax=Asbolus verrucosus TaxID=1661398 RepID=A0A482WDH8_ASBVE|nr:wnt domain containing protein [Asbolus verrucosus]